MKRIAVVFGLIFTALAVYGQDPWEYRRYHRWDNSWNSRPMPRAGACFFKEPGFRGDRFCVTRGDRLESLPGNFGDHISSIQVFGHARVFVFNDRDFRGGSREFRWSVDDLRTQRFGESHTWNNRISSIVIR
jgi:hypothetical protein